ncbi:hypothetical protein [Microcella sp.]|uniref:hypothetical protein n=1 Tax=Microcella sp. TaxID=1913979 RepID=UPI002565238F|nr:hypothetical protein [Microcella sp.]MBX9472333.1 hypothetical protein [Microcella sp.]
MNTPTPGRVGGRLILLTVAGVTTLLTLAMLLNDIVRTVYLLEGAYDLEVGLGSPMGVPASIPGDSSLSSSYYWTVLISSFEPLEGPKQLQALAIWVTTLTFVAAAVVILLLCRRLWTGRTFATSAATGLLILAVLALVTAWLAPWLRHRADSIALEQLGYATSGGEQWVQVHRYDLGGIDGPLLVLGTVLLLAGLVYLGARQLQNDTKGLI